MHYIKSEDHRAGSKALADTVIRFLNEGKRVLWILTGGSSIPACVEALGYIKQNYSLQNLTITITDERYGQVGHSDSSWQKLIQSGFNFDGIQSIPVLVGTTFDKTIENFRDKITRAFDENDIIISQFGVGADLHIAGILPNRVSDGNELVFGYHAEPWNRITLTFEAIKRINIAYVFIFGESKMHVISELQNNDKPLALKPANILKSIAEVYVYSDMI